MKRYTVKEENANKRLDVFLAEQLPTLSRAFVQRLGNEGKILVNKESEKTGYRIRVKDKITVDFEERELDLIADIDLPILYQDDDVLVVNKPEGVISHSRGRYWNEPSVASFVRQVTHQVGERAGIVHRLDRATSGVMICAKNHETLSWLQRQFSERKVKKIYTAVVGGHLDPKDAVIDMPIERNPKAPATFRVGGNGKQAATTYHVLNSSDKHDLVQLEPKTGRTHQLRVHLAYQGHPIVGDTLYKGEDFERLLLHAISLEIVLPNKKIEKFEAPLPIVFTSYMRSNDG